MTDAELETTVAVDLARESLYRFLSAAVSDPRCRRWSPIGDEANRTLAANAADLLRTEFEADAIGIGFGERPVAELDLALPDSGFDIPRDDWISEYDRVFGLVPSRDFPPYETEYHPNTEPSFRAQQMADIAGYFLAFGLSPSRTAVERPDHIALELEFMAVLIALRRRAESVESAAVCREAEASFFRDHLAWWLPLFAKTLGRKAGDGVYAAVARVLAALLPIERFRFGVAPPHLPRQPLPVTRTEDETGCAACSA